MRKKRKGIASPQTIMGSMLYFIRFITNVRGVNLFHITDKNYVMINVICKKLFMLLCEILVTFIRNVDAVCYVDTSSTRNILELLDINLIRDSDL